MDRRAGITAIIAISTVGIILSFILIGVKTDKDEFLRKHRDEALRRADSIQKIIDAQNGK